MLPCVSLEIGRGHPNYLDSFLNFYPGETILIKRGWRILKIPYLLGARGGELTRIYNRLRKSDSPPQLLLSFIARNLERELKSHKMVVVSHPVLVRALKDRYKVLYIHGEIAAPKESIVSAFISFVPLPETKERFLEFGMSEDKVFVTGLMIEPELLAVAEKGFAERIERLKNKRRLNVAFFSSGAYPPVHIDKIIKAANSAIRAGIRAFLFSGNNLRIKRCFERNVPGAEVISTKDRKEENEVVRDIIGVIDCFVAPAHERTNWCCGLGLPLFCLFPHIGSYAPLNYEFAYQQGVALPLNEKIFGEELLRLQEERKLIGMAEKGFGRFPIDGAKRAAEKVRELLACSQGHNSLVQNSKPQRRMQN